MTKLWLNHERLDVYRVALDVARWARATEFPRGDSALRDQAKRAADSAVLNIAEGSTQRGRARANHYRIAAGSAAEACAVLADHCLPVPEGVTLEDAAGLPETFFHGLEQCLSGRPPAGRPELPGARRRWRYRLNRNPACQSLRRDGFCH